jgi:steroid delta-isomerase-like uncharacterized protein
MSQFAAGAENQPGSPERAASDLLRRWYAAWNVHDVSAISALMTDDVLYEDPGATEPVTRGKAPVEAWARTAFRAVPDMRLELSEEWVSPGGAVIASYFRFTATFIGTLEPPGLAPTNRRFETHGMDRSEIRDGLIARHQIFWDVAERMRIAGALPARGSLAERLAFRAQHVAAWRMRRS